MNFYNFFFYNHVFCIYHYSQRLSADSEESYDDAYDMRLRSVTSGSSVGSNQQSSKRRHQRAIKKPEETHFWKIGPNKKSFFFCVE